MSNVETSKVGTTDLSQKNCSLHSKFLIVLLIAPIALFTARVRSTREGNVLTRVCPSIHPSVCPQGGGVGQVQPGGEGWVRSSCRGGGVGQQGGRGGSAGGEGVGQPGGGVGQPGGGGVGQLGEGWVSWGEGWVSRGEGWVSWGGRGGSAGGEGWVSRGGGVGKLGGGVGQPGGGRGGSAGGEGWVSMAGGMPLAFMQEDFLVLLYHFRTMVKYLLQNCCSTSK